MFSMWRSISSAAASGSACNRLSSIATRRAPGSWRICLLHTSTPTYKRYMAGTFAPALVVWGHDNGTCGFRVVGEGRSLRVENRIQGRMPIPTWHSRRRSPRGSGAWSGRSSLRQCSRETLTKRRGFRGSGDDERKRSMSWRGARWRAMPSVTGWSSTTRTPPGWSSNLRPRGHLLGVDPQLRAYLGR